MSKKKVGRTPSPWHIIYGTNIFGKRLDINNDACICNTGGHSNSHIDATVENRANAEFIILVCNNHDALVAIVEELLDVRTGDGLLDPAYPVFARAQAILREVKGE
jgi:hypothetical protein